MTTTSGPSVAARVAVIAVSCRTCGDVLRQSVRAAESDEIDQSPRGCSPAFAQWASCPKHPAPPPDNGLSYSESALPLMFSVLIYQRASDRVRT